MAAAERFVVANPHGAYADAPEGTDLALVQSHIDANPAGYRAFSAALAQHAAKLVRAAQARDAAALSTLANDMQPMCKACHDKFWYPEEYAP